MSQDEIENLNNELNKEITTQEILQIGNQLKSKKATGLDNISNEVIKVFINVKLGTQIIKNMFNSVL